MSDNASDMIADYLRLLRRPLAMPEVAASSLSTAFPANAEGRPCALLLSPHPDDECLTGALPLRLKQELGWQIVNVAVSLGSNVSRREARKIELSKACAALDFNCVLTEMDGFSDLKPNNRGDEAWADKVARLAEIIGHTKPQAIFLPHPEDANPTHIGTHHLGIDALTTMGANFSCSLIQTEYWHPLAEPNLMIGVGNDTAAKLLSALACYEGENARNPFDARFPAYLIDNVRRGSEIVGSAGAASAAMDFAMLYRLGLWHKGKFMPSALKRIIGAGDALDELFCLK